MKYNIQQDILYAKEILNINESELSERLGIPRSSLLRWEKGYNINSSSLEKIYSFFYREGVKLNKVKEEYYKDKEDLEHKYLFHGSKFNFDLPVNLNMSKSNNDFGKGFYLGENFNQAGSFVCDYNSSSVLVANLSLNDNLKVYEYDVDEEWMICIAYFRNKLVEFEKSDCLRRIIEPLKDYDIIKAPIADNRMYQILEEFIQGNITDLQCKSALSVSNLGKQYVLKTERAIESCKIMERCYLCDEEKKNYGVQKRDYDTISSQKVKFVKREYAGKGKYIDEILL